MILGEFHIKNRISAIVSFRFICLKRLNYDQQNCADFEARFCCLNSNTDVNSNHILSRKRTSSTDLPDPDSTVKLVDDDYKLNTTFENLPESNDDLRNFS